jgi:hypothetical protein
MQRRLWESVVLSEHTISPLAAARVSAQRHSLAAQPQQVLMEAAIPPTPAAGADLTLLLLLLPPWVLRPDVDL